ncbi:DinB family protein [Paenibacillus soyae]|uniref:DinB family protein n=1 Tax=Paenibacillus soyae TaxID=2969249 RepID=A0A9X2MLE1_9BACL|nr:DinB family protein [Paenibacillus soyae]MCR2802796.1 DinB family protein [Paenibacillus soyae]
MLFDLRGGAEMSPIVGMLYSAVRENSMRLQTITSGMSQEELDYKGSLNQYNSTAQLIKHIMYVDLNWVFRISGAPLPQSLKDEYGPVIDGNQKLPMIEGVSLGTLLAKYEGVIERLKNVCSQIKDSDLDRVVTFGHENEKQATIRWGLWHMADHSRYHQAHINQLRRWFKQEEMR